ncbi:MAG: hypothetical protein EOM26_10145 [Alphaproteobacteria bacterium]|nr:hypothetical protein [Alphaproteobacteria bacterium]
MYSSMKTLIDRTVSGLTRYVNDRGGAIAPMFVIALPVIVGVTGMALETAQAYMVRERLSHALDAAALAAASSEVDEAELRVQLEKFFDANYPPEKLGTTYDLKVAIDGEKINVSAKADFNTRFLRLVGVNEIPVAARTQVTREVQGIEVVLVLDVTGSMETGGRYIELQKATQAFINTMFSRVRDPQYIRIAIVPYSATVNIGSIASNPDFIQSGHLPEGVVYNPAESDMWAGCVMARASDDDEYDTDTVDGGKWAPFWWESDHPKCDPGRSGWEQGDDESGYVSSDCSNNWWDDDNIVTKHVTELQMRDEYEVNVVTSSKKNDKRGPNTGCPVTNPITPLTSSQDTLIDAAKELTYWNRGGTLSVVGMAWGWRVLSPTEPFESGKQYNDKYWRKYAVIMTDGNNGFYQNDKTAYMRKNDKLLGTTNPSSLLDDRFVNICERMRSDGISIYSVIFTSGANDTTRDTFESCSGSANYEEAEDVEDLLPVFVKIAKEISTLHLSQ